MLIIKAWLKPRLHCAASAASYYTARSSPTLSCPKKKVSPMRLSFSFNYCSIGSALLVPRGSHYEPSIGEVILRYACSLPLHGTELDPNM